MRRFGRASARGAMTGLALVIGLAALSTVAILVAVGPLALARGQLVVSAASFLVVPVVVLGIAATDEGLVGTESWLRRRGVEAGDADIERMRAWLLRTRLMRGIGFVGPLVFAGTAAALANASFVDTMTLPVHERLVDLAGGWWPRSLAGYAVGALVAEVLRPPPVAPRGRRGADLHARDVPAYLQPMARWAPRVLALAAVAIVLATLATDTRDAAANPASALAWTVGTLAATEAGRRYVVSRPQPTSGDIGSLRADDAARASTVHALSGAAIAIIGVTGFGFAGDVAAAPGLGPWQGLATAAAFLTPIACVGIWLGYGTEWVWPRTPTADETVGSLAAS